MPLVREFPPIKGTLPRYGNPDADYEHGAIVTDPKTNIRYVMPNVPPTENKHLYQVFFEEMLGWRPEGLVLSGEESDGDGGADDDEAGEVLDGEIGGDREYEDDEGAESDYEYEEEYTFDFDPMAAAAYEGHDPAGVHKALYKYARVSDPIVDSETRQNRLWKVFGTMAALSDPETAPSDVGDHWEALLSLDMVADLVLALCKPLYEKGEGSDLPVFTFAYDVAHVAERCLHLLNVDDTAALQRARSSQKKYRKDLHLWLPPETLASEDEMLGGYHRMKLLYTVVCVAVLLLSKMYPNTHANPFLAFLLQTWKNQTNVIILGIEIDRGDENAGFPGYPPAIRQAVKGAAAVRAALAAVLTVKDSREHDLKHEPLENFMNPWGRHFGSGALEPHLIRIYMASLLMMGSDLDDVSGLVENLETDDRYDEDIQYMFEFESGPDIDADDSYQMHHRPLIPQYHRDPATGSPLAYPLHPSCFCHLQHDEEDEEDEEGDDEGENEKEQEKVVDGRLVKVDNDENHTGNESILWPHFDKSLLPAGMSPDGFDELSRDCRDFIRGENRFLTDDFVALLRNSQQDPSVFVTSPSKLLGEVEGLTKETVHSQGCEVIIRSVAWVCQYEIEGMSMTSQDQEKQKHDPNISIKNVRGFMLDKDNFSKMVKFNPSATFSIIDELLMVPLHRHETIKFLAGLQPSQWLVNYFHQLLSGTRGNPPNGSDPKETRFSFSRRGAVELSEVEQEMLVLGFLTTCTHALSRDSDDNSEKEKLVVILCLMLQSLSSQGVLKVSQSEYRFLIQSILFPWIGSVPTAKMIYFESKKYPSKEEEEREADLKLMARRKEQLVNEVAVSPMNKLFICDELKPDSFDLIQTVLMIADFYGHHPDQERMLIGRLRPLQEVTKAYANDAMFVRICLIYLNSMSAELQKGNRSRIIELLSFFGIADISKRTVIDAVDTYMETREDDSVGPPSDLLLDADEEGQFEDADEEVSPPTTASTGSSPSKKKAKKKRKAKRKGRR